MSDREYEAFLRATAGMDESQKRLAAQSLYSLTDFYNGKFSKEVENAPKQPINGLHKKPYKPLTLPTITLFCNATKTLTTTASTMDVIL